MAYDEKLAERMRTALAGCGDVVEKRSIGGSLTFMLNGHMCSSVRAAGVMVRVGPAKYGWALDQPHVTPLGFGGKRPVGYVCIAPDGIKGRELGRWMKLAVAFVGTLPARGTKGKS